MRAAIEAAAPSFRYMPTPTSAAREAPLLALPDATVPPLALRAWRGRSGRRYVVSVYPLGLDSDDAYCGALLLAAQRDGEGRRRLVGVSESGALGVKGFNGAWIAAMRRQGANELHVHLLAATRRDRLATMADLLTAES
jgi:hypothetical protein